MGCYPESLAVSNVSGDSRKKSLGETGDLSGVTACATTLGKRQGMAGTFTYHSEELSLRSCEVHLVGAMMKGEAVALGSNREQFALQNAADSLTGLV